MTDSEDSEIEISLPQDNETDECMEFQIGLMIEPETQEISIVTSNGNKTNSQLLVAPTNNDSAKRKRLNSEQSHSSRSTIFPYPSTSKSITNHRNDALDTATILSAIDNLRKLMTEVAAKTDKLCEEFKEIRNHTTAWRETAVVDRTSLGIPLGTKEELKSFEEKIKNDDVPRALFKKFLQNIDDRGWNRYISKCLKACFKYELASICSFYGKNNNMEVQYLLLIRIIKECVAEKFPSIRPGDVNNNMTRWFHLAHDIYRRSNKAIEK